MMNTNTSGRIISLLKIPNGRKVFIKPYTAAVAVEKNTVTGKRSRDVFYVPVLEYTLNGKTHTQRMQSFFIDTELEEGDKVTIFVDPDKPERFYAPAYHKSEEISLFDILFSACKDTNKWAQYKTKNHFSTFPPHILFSYLKKGKKN